MIYMVTLRKETCKLSRQRTMRNLETMRSWRFLPYLQTNKLACHDFIAPGRRHETLGSETKKIYDSQHSKQQEGHVCVDCLCLPNPIEVTLKDPIRSHTHSGFVSQLRNPNSRNLNIIEETACMAALCTRAGHCL